MTKGRTTILVTDGDTRAALAATRSLGRRGDRVVVVGDKDKTLAGSSRYCWKSCRVGDPEKGPAEYATQIGTVARREGIEIILPMTEPSIRALRISGAVPAGCLLAAPSSTAFDTVSDKVNLARLAAELGGPSPRTLFVPAGGNVASTGIDPLIFPVVVKPMASSIVSAGKMLHGRVAHADHPGQLAEIYRSAVFRDYPSLIQERIRGAGTGLFTLFDRDRHLALFAHRRIREKPPSGGVSVVCESVPLDGEMVLDAQKLLSAVRWTGVAMVEFKRDDRDGRAKLIEINGRFWGSLQLAVSAGIDFPSLLIDYLRGDGPSVLVDHYAVGYKLKWLPGILDHLLIRMRHSRRDLHLPADHESIWRVLYESLRMLEKNTSYDSLCRHDPMPFLCELKTYCRTVLGPS
jgi:predicted ATP-grasp superfamily ATP-dependent carboligase